MSCLGSEIGDMLMALALLVSFGWGTLALVIAGVLVVALLVIFGLLRKK